MRLKKAEHPSPRTLRKAREIKILNGMIAFTRRTNGSRQQSLSWATKRHTAGREFAFVKGVPKQSKSKP
jgi:geranyltranstransferase